MRREEKDIIINDLVEQLENNNHFYLADISELNAADTSALRRMCFMKNVKLIVVKNTLLAKAFDKTDKDYNELTEVLKGNTSIMFSEQGSVPAKVIKEFRKKSNKKKPLLKGAFVEESIYIGEEQLEALSAIKSKEELIGDIVLLLQSPAKNVISALQSGGQKLVGILETLEKKEE